MGGLYWSKCYLEFHRILILIFQYEIKEFVIL